MSGMKRVLLFGTFSIFFATAIFMLAGYGVNVFLARFLGPADYGIYSVVISLVSLLSLLLVRGMETATSKFISQRPGSAEAVKASALKLNLLIGLAAAAVYFLSADLIAFLLQDPSIAQFIRFSVIIIPAYFLYPAVLGYLNGLKKYSKQSLVIISYSIAKFVAIFLFVYFGFSIWGALFGFALAPLVGVAFGMFFSRSEKIKGDFDWKKLLRFSIPLTIFIFSLNSASAIGLLLVKSILVENALVGYYRVALNIGELVYYFTIALSSALFPFVSNSFAKQNSLEFNYHLKKAFKYFLIFVVPATVFIWVFSKEFVLLLFGNEFLAATQPLTILVFAELFVSLLYLLCIILIAIDRQKLAMLIAIITLAIAWVSNTILIPIFSLNGAALATLIAFLTGSIIAAIAVWRFLPRVSHH